MTEAFHFLLALVMGVFLGSLFFGGLWWTVRRGVSSKRAALWFIGSMLIRTGIVLFGFYFILGDDWKRLLAGLLGFIGARMIVMRLTREADQSRAMAQGAGHAP